MGKGVLPTPKQNETGGFQCLGHSNWIICSPLSHFCSNIFSLFHLHTGRPILITPEGQLSEMGILPTSKQNKTGGFQCLGPSNWGTISYYPRRPIIRNGNSSNFKTE